MTLELDSLKHNLESLGWGSPYSDVWTWLASNKPEVVILAPPLDTIPSPQGNAIYVLVERLAEKLSFASLILCNKGKKLQSLVSPVQDRILYYGKPLRPTLIDKILPYSARKRLWGTARLDYQRYARSAGHVARILGPRAVIIQDMPSFGPVVQQSAPQVKLILHQHASSFLSLSLYHHRRVNRSLDSIVFVAQQSILNIQAKYGEITTDHHVIYNGVDLQHYDPAVWAEPAQNLRTQLGIKSTDTILLFAGRIIPGKGVLEAAQAFQAANIPESHFIIAGDMETSLFADDTYTSSLKTLVSQSPSIHPVGAVSQKELPMYYAAADAVIIPSIQSEGLPKVVTEALAMGKPVIASDRGGIWELLNREYSGWYLDDPKDEAGTAAVIRQAMIDQAELHRRSALILERDRPRMDEQRMVHEFEKILQMWVKA